MWAGLRSAAGDRDEEEDVSVDTSLAEAVRDPAAAPTRPLDLAGLEAAALAATRDAAIACQRFVGRGDKHAADAAATEAMRRALAKAPGLGTVVIGEGEKDGAPMLYNGERLGAGGPPFDIAVDPLECTSFCAKGLPGSLATVAFAEEGALLRPGPSHYMGKLVVPRAARNAIDIADPPELTAARVARALGKDLAELRVVVLDKPRHAELIERLRRAGASVVTPSDGDVGGALEALLPEGEADLLMGVGGTPEGLMTACAVRALGGGMQARFVPQSDAEAGALARAGLDTERRYGLGELVDGSAVFAATGITGGSLLARPRPLDGAVVTDSLVISERGVRLVQGRSISEGEEVG
jgi:fructose-1,6-bisphosphatase II